MQTTSGRICAIWLAVAMIGCLSQLSLGFALESPLKNLLQHRGSSSKTRPSADLSSSDSDASTTETEATKLESIVANAKSLISIDRSRQDTLISASAAGLAVALAMVPEAIAFSFVAGVNPLVGLWTTVALGFTAAALGGRAGICSSASGACSVVVASLCRSHGAAHLSACAVMAGILQLLFSYFKVGRLIRLVPHPVMLGFVNGLAILMTRAQLVHFKGMALNTAKGASMYGITGLTMLLVKLLPKITKLVPPTLGAVVLASLLSYFGKIPVTTLADVAGASTFGGGWSVVPKLALPAVPWTLPTLRTVFPYALTMAAVGSIESLLTMQLLDGIVDDGRRGSTGKELAGQGAGNVVAGLFGGIGGCALLGQSLINVQAGGGASRWSGMSMALFLALSIVLGAPLLAQVPVASLVGVMLLVCSSTFSWSSLRLWNQIPKLDVMVIALVSLVTVQKDLAVAVVMGTMASALGFCWKQSTNLSAKIATTNAKRSKAAETVYQLRGPLFFGSTRSFQELLNVKSDPERVVWDFANTRLYDHSALEVVQSMAAKYAELGKTVVLRHLSRDCIQLLQRLEQTGSSDASVQPPLYIIESDPDTDPVYGIAEDAHLYRDVSAT